MKALFQSVFLCLLVIIVFVFLQKPAVTQNKYVTEVQITGYRNDQPIQTYHYTAPSKISSILTYLRLLNPHGKQAPTPANDSLSYQILLIYSDGSANAYLLHDFTSFSQTGGMWKRVKPAQAQLLYPLLRLLPVDA